MCKYLCLHHVVVCVWGGGSEGLVPGCDEEQNQFFQQMQPVVKHDVSLGM